MKTIRHADTLVYYDGVQVFVGCDSDSANYIGVMTGAGREVDQYLVTEVTRDLLDRFCAGAIDLRSVILEASAGGWFSMETNGDFGQPLTLCEQAGKLDNSGLLPEAGFLLPNSPKP